MLKRFLITPGPTPVPPEVLSAGAEPVIHHRAPRFTEILNEVVAGLKYVYQTRTTSSSSPPPAPAPWRRPSSTS